MRAWTDITHAIIQSVFIRSPVVADSPGSQFDCVVTEFQPINLTCPGHHLLPALSSRWGCVLGEGGGLPYAMLVKIFYSP